MCNRERSAATLLDELARLDPQTRREVAIALRQISLTFAEVPDAKTAAYTLGVLARLLDPNWPIGTTFRKRCFWDTLRVTPTAWLETGSHPEQMLNFRIRRPNSANVSSGATPVSSACIAIRTRAKRRYADGDPDYLSGAGGCRRRSERGPKSLSSTPSPLLVSAGFCWREQQIGIEHWGGEWQLDWYPNWPWPAWLPSACTSPPWDCRCH